MKAKNGICIILTLLLIASSLSYVNTIKADNVNRDTMPIDVSKKVWDGNNWVDEITTDYGDTVKFNITITYYKNTEEGIWADDIVAVDTLPESFLFLLGTANYEPSSIVDNVVTWDLSGDYEILLEDNESISIEFEAKALNYGENINYVEVTAYEVCCGWDLYGDADAKVNVGEPLVLNKQVFDPQTEQWVEDLTSYVKKSEPVKFRLTITYNGYFDVEIMKCMFVEDFLPECCLVYLGNEKYTYPDDKLFDDPQVTVSEDHKYVKYDWTNKKFNLYADESISIEFEASVVEYCYDTVINCAYVEIYNCLGCPDPVILNSTDCATIYCYPPNSMIEKKVLDPDTEDWVEEIAVYVGDSVTFKIDLTYYGNYNLSGISILDQLHPSMEFSDSSSVPPPDVEGNLVWWNFTEVLEDSETISIEFTAKAIGGTGSGPGINMVFVTAYEQGHLYEDSDTAGVIVKTNLPPCPPDIKGDEFGLENQVLTFYAITGDMDGDDIYYMFDWGDGTFSQWIGPYEVLAEADTTHSWESAGTYNVKVKAKDTPIGAESMWSHYPVVVKIVVPPVLSLNITIKHGIGLSVSVSIQNNGEAEINNIDWTLKVDRRGLIQKTLSEDTGTIASLDVGDVEKLTGSPYGFGLMKITVQINSPDIVDPIEVTADGFIFTKLIYVP